MRLVKRLLVLLFAVIFLIEVWLWDHLEPLVARVVALIPLQRLKGWVALRIESLSPATTLVVFLVPAIFIFPLKIAGLWLFAHHYWMSGIAMIVTVKLVGIGVAAFVFDVTRPKLLQMAWFRQLYDFIIGLRTWAYRLVDPVRQQIELRLRLLRMRLARGRRAVRNRVRPANS